MSIIRRDALGGLGGLRLDVRRRTKRKGHGREGRTPCRFHVAKAILSVPVSLAQLSACS